MVTAAITRTLRLAKLQPNVTDTIAETSKINSTVTIAVASHNLKPCVCHLT